MQYWWVNQNQTYKHEIQGGYLWSPKRKSNQSINPFYEFMKEVAPGDIIFSFQGTYIRALGISQSYCFESPKPLEFDTAGASWSNIGWKISVRYTKLSNSIRPSDEMNSLRPLLPERYSPLQPSGRGNQSVYLTNLPEDLAEQLIYLIGKEARELVHNNQVDDQNRIDTGTSEIKNWEDRLTDSIYQSGRISETEKESIVMARRGQGQFKNNVLKYEKHCRLTGVDKIEHLIASHCKPWRDCETDEERLDGENGLLLTPNADHLFDRGFISFEDNGRLLISPVAHLDSLQRMGVEVSKTVNVGGFSEGQKQYLDYHRDYLFLSAKVNSN